MIRRTKIVATLGPATDKDLKSVIAAGVDVVRVNMSHGKPEDHINRVKGVRQCSKDLNREVAVLVDLQGPKIRIDRFRDQKVTLEVGAKFALDADLGVDDGDQDAVGITYKTLPQDVDAGDVLLLDDGRLVLKVDRTTNTRIECTVVVGGELSNNKGINRQGGGLSAAALTDKDRTDIKLAAQLEADYLAISFPRSANDVHEARELLRAAGGRGGIVAKIERAEALDCLKEIIAASDAVMIARGDLGVEIGDATLPPVQKRIIKLARTMNRIVITATQMMETMIENQIPTRAEVFDVANAVFDGTDAVMLSAETAAGKHPAVAVSAMDRICREAEKQQVTKMSDHRINTRFSRSDEAIAMSAMYAANHLGVKAIAALTESGSTALWMSRISSDIPIYALSSQQDTCRRVNLYRGVKPVEHGINSQDHVAVNKAVVDILLEQGAVSEGDLLIITKGDLMGVLGGTNAMKIVRVGELVDPS